MTLRLLVLDLVVLALPFVPFPSVALAMASSLLASLTSRTKKNIIASSVRHFTRPFQIQTYYLTRVAADGHSIRSCTCSVDKDSPMWQAVHCCQTSGMQHDAGCVAFVHDYTRINPLIKAFYLYEAASQYFHIHIACSFWSAVCIHMVQSRQ